MGVAAVPLMVAGGLLGAKGALDEGRSRREASYASAAELRVNAGQEEAAGQFAGEEELRKTKMLQSRMLAIAGASGAGALDPTVVNLASGAEAEGHLAAATQRYNAKSAAVKMRNQADITQREGDAYAKASRYKAAGSLLSMASAFK